MRKRHTDSVTTPWVIGVGKRLLVKGKNQQNTTKKNFEDYTQPPLTSNTALTSHYYVNCFKSQHINQHPPWNFNSHPTLPFILCVPRVLVNDIVQVLISLLKMRHNESFFISGKVWAIHYITYTRHTFPSHFCTAEPADEQHSGHMAKIKLGFGKPDAKFNWEKVK